MSNECCMSQNNGRAPGAPWISSYMTVKNPKAALEFYQKAFGFTVRESVADENGNIMHAELTYHDALIMMGPECNYEGIEMKSPASLKITPPSGLYIYCEDVDAFYKKAIAAGAKCLKAPADMFWGDRVCKLADADGYFWNFATHTGKITANPFCCGEKKSCDGK